MLKFFLLWKIWSNACNNAFSDLYVPYSLNEQSSLTTFILSRILYCIKYLQTFQIKNSIKLESYCSVFNLYQATPVLLLRFISQFLIKYFCHFQYERLREQEEMAEYGASMPPPARISRHDNVSPMSDTSMSIHLAGEVSCCSMVQLNH